MGAAHGAAADRDGGGDHLVRADHFHQQTAAHHVGHGVERANLVEVDLVDGSVVDLRLRLGDQGVDLAGIRLDGVGQIEVLDNAADVVQVPMLMMMGVIVSVFVLMPVCIFQLLVAVHGHAHMGAVDTAALGGSSLHVHTGKPQRIHLPDKLIPVDQLAEGTHEHVTRGAHAAFQIQGSHECGPPCAEGPMVTT